MSLLRSTESLPRVIQQSETGATGPSLDALATPIQTPDVLVVGPAVIVGVVALFAIAWALKLFVAEVRLQEDASSTDARDDEEDTAESVSQTDLDPDLSFDELGGMTGPKTTLRTQVLEPRGEPGNQEDPVSRTDSLLLYGPPGCGQSRVAEALAGELGAAFVEVTREDLTGADGDDTVETLAAAFEVARDDEPSVLFLDGIDAIGGDRSGDVTASERGAVASLLAELDDLDGTDVGIVAATTSVADVDDAIIGAGRFDKHVEVPPPDARAREAILTTHLEGRPVADDLDVADVVDETAGYAVSDVELVADLATRHALEEQDQIDGEYLLRAVEETGSSLHGWLDRYDSLGDDPSPERSTESVAQDDVGSEHGTRPRDSFADIPGMTEVKGRLRERVLQPVQNAEESGSAAPGGVTGVLLYGPPGCGKTYLAHGLAAELGRPLFEVTPEKLLAADDPSATLEAVIEAAVAGQPSVCALDDLDAIVPADGESVIAPRIADQLPGLLAELESEAVFVVGTARHHENVDRQVLDAGCFDERVAVLAPDAETREAIIRAAVPPGRFADDFDWDRIHDATDGLTAREVNQVASATVRDAITSGYPVMADRLLEIVEETTTGTAQ